MALYTRSLKLSLTVSTPVQSVTLACFVQSWFHFSFANYYNPANMNFGALRVINDDYIRGPSGFGYATQIPKFILAVLPLTKSTLQKAPTQRCRDLHIYSGGPAQSRGQHGK